jgi:nucleoside 2-deoxyribosyltransferase
MALNVFLSGKVDKENGSWRDEILGFTRGDWNEERCEYEKISRWEVVRHLPDWGAPFKPWPTEPNTSVLGLHNFVGPYRVVLPDEPTKHKGEFHGTEWSGQHGCPDDYWKSSVAIECARAIARSDIVFVYLNSPDCFGSLVELGYAKAARKFVYLVVDDQATWDWDDYWFAEQFANCTAVLRRHEWASDDEKATTNAGIAAHLRDALVQWTAQPSRSESRPSVVPLADVSTSLANISKWTSDPRVRNEAQRVLKSLQTG